ncbi:adenylate/guanylate cyclase domain-containing protein [Thermodesulfobacteriota bacterium]
MTTDGAKRKLIAVVHADVKDYSRLMREDDEWTVRTLSSHRREMYRLVELHQGRVADTAGDGFLLEFASALDAVRFSVDFQRELKKRNKDQPEDRRMEFRIGVNIGDVIHDGGAIFGDGVNIAARLEGLADPGGICISGAAHDQVRGKIVGFEYLGEKSVKNIAEPVPTYRVLLDPGDSRAPAGRTHRMDPKRRRRTVLAVVGVLLVVAAAMAMWHHYLRPSTAPKEAATDDTPALELPDKPSIAVLPFVNMSGDPKQEYFSDGITEEIITGLSKIPQLFVIARNSSFTFKGKPVNVRDVGKKLGVRYVLEGSVRKQGDKVRITAQLIDAQTGGHVWSERYDREVKDIFALQDEIAMKLMIAMQVRFTEGEQLRLWRKKTGKVNREAYEKLTEARMNFSRGTEAGNLAARKFLEEALELEPRWAAAYAQLAGVHMTAVLMGWTKDPRESRQKAYKMAKRALSLDDSLDGPHYTLGYIYALSGRLDEAIAEGERAVELNPNGAGALAVQGLILNWAGRPREAIPIIRKAIRLNPIPPPWYYGFLGMSFRLTQQYDKAIAAYKRGLDVQPDHPICLLGLAATYSLVGRPKEARETATELLRFYPRISLKHLEKVLPHKNPAAKKELLDALRKAGLN